MMNININIDDAVINELVEKAVKAKVDALVGKYFHEKVEYNLDNKVTNAINYNVKTLISDHTDEIFNAIDKEKISKLLADAILDNMGI